MSDDPTRRIGGPEDEPTRRLDDDRTRPLGPDDVVPAIPPHDPTRPLRPSDQTRPMDAMGSGRARLDDERARRARVIMAVAGSALALLIVVLLLADRGGDPTVLGSPTPSETVSEQASPTEEASPTATASATEETQGDEPREPSDQDAAAFSESFRPQGAQAIQSVTADVDGDGAKEVVFASIHDDGARIDVARWDGREYQVVYTSQGGAAERIDDFRVADYTGDDTREIVTVQSVGAQGQSLSVWGWNGQAFAPQRASGGCWNGSHTFGVTGASIQRGRIRATCDGSPLPTAAWPSDVYVWDAEGGGWVYEGSEEA